jgi:predicted dehydrogenase
MPEPRRYLISSLGSVGRRHLKNLSAVRPGSEIAVLRRPQPKAEPLPSGAAHQFETIEQAVAFRPEAAILAGPAPTHVPLALALVEQSIPVLMEKPLSHDLSRVAELQRLATARQVPVMVGYNLRFNPSLIAFRELLGSGDLGTVRAARAEVGQYLPDWRPQADYRGCVSASRALGGGALLVELCLEYDSPRRLVSIHLDFLQRTAARSCKVIGTAGTATWDAMHHRVELNIVDPERRVETITRPMSEGNEMYVAELSAFLDSVEQSREAPIRIEEGADVLAIVMAAKRSMISGRPELPVSAASAL